MQQIADKVGVHVTTVSRAVDDKWIQTPRGIFPLKRFFVGGTTSADGEEVAWDRVRHQAAGNHRQRGQARSRFRDDELVEELAKARPHRRPPHGHQVPQGDEHPQLPRPPRLVEGREDVTHFPPAIGSQPPAAACAADTSRPGAAPRRARRGSAPPRAASRCREVLHRR